MGEPGEEMSDGTDLFSDQRKTAEKPRKLWDRIEVAYDAARWRLLDQYRSHAASVMEDLERQGIVSYVHGSIARGDVDDRSDVDMIIFEPILSQKIEFALTSSGYTIYLRRITQATPSHALKGHLYLDPYQKTSMTFPLLTFRRLENEFYRFGGMLDLEGMVERVRVPGCTKRLTLIEPTESGHLESRIDGREAEVSRLLGVSMEIVKERQRVLTRRDEVGRTGVFLTRDLAGDESFDQQVKRLIDSNPAVRRVYSRRR